MVDGQQVQKKAKEIMDSFLAAIEKIPDATAEEHGAVELRNDAQPSCDAAFRQRMLKNAKRVEDDFLVMEKGKWKE